MKLFSLEHYAYKAFFVPKIDSNRKNLITF